MTLANIFWEPQMSVTIDRHFERSIHSVANLAGGKGIPKTKEPVDRPALEVCD